jgi:hypothetical protein
VTPGICPVNQLTAIGSGWRMHEISGTRCCLAWRAKGQLAQERRRHFDGYDSAHLLSIPDGDLVSTGADGLIPEYVIVAYSSTRT